MKEYILSLHAKTVLSERKLKIEWIEKTLNDPDRTEPDLKDNELEHKLKIIKEYDNRVLRVVFNKSVNPVLIVTAYFDRKMKGKL